MTQIDSQSGESHDFVSHVRTILKSDRSVFENTLANTEDPNEMPHIKKAAFHQGVHCLLRPLSHQSLAQSGSYFQSAVRSQANLDIFRGKGPITASLQRPWRLMEYSLVIFCALTTLLLRAAISLRLNCTDSVLKTQCRDFQTFLKF